MRARILDKPAGHQEVTSSNSTLNAFLGGKQKSWMVGNGGAMPTPRPAITQKSVAAVLPSPSPSDEPSPARHLPASPPINGNHAEVRSELVHNGFSESAPDDRRQDGRQTFVLQHQDNSVQRRPSNIVQTSTTDQQQRVLSNPAVPSTRNVSYPTVQRPSMMLSDTSRRRTGSPPAKKQKTSSSVAAIPSLKPQIPLIDRHIMESGGVGALDTSLEEPRFRLLRDACNNQDYFYVALHQMFCLWSSSPQSINLIDGLSDSKVTSIAFGIIGQLIRKNDRLNKKHLIWFSQFPSPLSDLIFRSDYYQATVTNVSMFLNILASDWTQFTTSCQQRGYPPLVDELVHRLKLLSPVLQGVVFTATRRNLGIIDDQFGHEMEVAFTEDREGHRALASRYNTAFPPSEREVRSRNESLIAKYIDLRTRQMDTRRQQYHQRTNSSQPFALASNSPSQGQRPLQNQLSRSSQSGSPQQSNHVISGQPPNPHLLSRMVSSPPLQSGFPSSIITSGPVFQNPLFGPSSSTSPVLQSPNPQSPRSSQYGHWQPPASQSNHILSPLNPSNSSSMTHSVSQGQQQQAVSQQNMSGSLIHSRASQDFSRQQQQDQSRHMQQWVQNGNMLPNPTLNGNPRPVNMPSSLISGVQSAQSPNSTLSRYSTAIAQQNSMPGSLGAGSPAYLDRNALIPPAGFVHPPQQPNPDMTALHQAHLRSPKLRTMDSSPSLKGTPLGRYYQAVTGFALEPVTLPRLPLSRYQFFVRDHLYSRISRDTTAHHNGMSQPLIREISRGSLQYRLRCIQLKKGQTDCKKSDWVVSDSAWPLSIALEINGHMLEVRRKNLHAKDLPVDITSYVWMQGEGRANNIRVSIPKAAKSHRDHEYAFAVEIVEIFKHQQILDMCLKNQRIPSSQTLDKIKASLSGSLNDDDDDIAMVADDLTIDLADPFMAKIFDIPVRGTDCLHRECFDLETFLVTRNSKPKHPNQPSMIDVWKCPLCSRDARPQSLLVDDFLVSVREKLAADNKLDVKAILVSPDGSWKPKPEVLSMNRSSSQSDDDSDIEDKKPPVLQRTQRKESDFIILDDD